MLRQKNLGGRPRIFSNDLQEFKKLYLDPLSTPQGIIDSTGMSRASFYRYSKMACVPVLRVAISGPSGSLSRWRQSAVAEPADQFDLEMARLLASMMDVRFKIGLIDGVRALDLLNRGEVDLSIGRMTDSKKRRKSLYFSHPYLTGRGSPHGAVLGPKRLDFDLTEGRSKKRILGVVRGTLHSEFAMENLSPHISVRNFSSEADTEHAMREDRIDFRLTNPMGTHQFLQSSPSIEIKPERFVYAGGTCIAASPSAAHWLPVVNRALEQAHYMGWLQELEMKYLCVYSSR